MSKINQIQQVLLEQGGGEFQKFADTYLVEKGFGPINSIGSVAGANKVRTGTPDTLLATQSGRYIFAEHTTQQSGLLSKMKADLSKCFDENKTGVPITKIKCVIFCFTGKLSAEEGNVLAVACQEKGVNLELFGIDALSFDLYSKYPGLALDFLGVQIDTGQIVSPEKFVSLYNKGKLATRLDLGFHFREEELNQLLGALKSERLVILTGKAGTGKSRLALEVCREFSNAHPEYKVMCILGRIRDLWEDLKSQFSRPGNFLILVDDANRISQFSYIVDLLLHQREDQQIKAIATVRDYALSKIRETAYPLGGGVKVNLPPFTDDQIKEFITDEYEIHNYLYLDRIVDIAQGNPRLAVMAAEIAKEDSLSSIYDVSSLYDNYFSSIKQDLKGEGTDLVSADLLMVAAIVSFFKAVDRTNEEMMNAIEMAFNITSADFWEAADRLHELEIIDMHENEVLRVSDQVLGTYLFYLAFFKEQILDFSVLLTHFFPKLQQRLIDSINPVLNAFDPEQVNDTMCPAIEQAWTKFEAEGDDKGLMHLIDVFWFVKQTDTLLWAKGQIDEMKTESVEIANITFESSSNAVSSPSILSVLSRFAFAQIENARMALDLLMRYVVKQPSGVPFLLQILTRNYGFRRDSYLRKFAIQRVVVDVVCNSVEEGSPLFSRLFLALCKNYLGTHFETHRMKGEREIQFTRFDLLATLEVAALRKVIWVKLFALYRAKEFQPDILELIVGYGSSPYKLINSDVVKDDAEYVLPFLESELNSSNYKHCVLLHDYISVLERHNVEFSERLKERFTNDTYALAEILLPEWAERQGMDLSYEEYEQYKEKKLEQCIADYTLDDYEHFFEHCLEIKDAFGESRDFYQLASGIENALLLLADSGSILYQQVLALYLGFKDPFQLNGDYLIAKLVEQQDHDKTLQFLDTLDFPTKKRWLYHLHAVTPADAVDEKQLEHLYQLYQTADLTDLPNGLDYLLKYLQFDAQVITKVVSILLEKVDGAANVPNALTLLFNPHTKVAEKLSDFFAEDLNLLKQAYFAVEATQAHNDYEGSAFSQMLDLDPKFIEEFITWKYKNTKNGWLSSHDESREYMFIWARSDYHEIMDKVVNSIYEHESEPCYFIDPYLKAFFRNSKNKGDSILKAEKRQDQYLLHLIDKRYDDSKFIRYLFGLIAQFVAKRRCQFVERFVQHNNRFDVFEHLPLEPNSWSSSGSKVPGLQERVKYWEALLPIMKTIELLQNKQYVERQIRQLQTEIEQEKKRDFIRD